ncbi:MAG: PH domain-containing protein [candidate division KSB1 bacterium]|nr:PH domain-containing protein [candidate division KSB1 bacterium]MDZ7304535.1 PH domain-containing protein [candidate division KSB1 bacterium]MDZ7313704.1 PH domain-containing protein [candidate division KSB1 bacterium]
MVDVEGMKETATRILQTGEKIDCVVGGKMSYEVAPGNRSIVHGLFVATNDRVLVVIKQFLQNKTKDFTYSQTTGVWMSEDKNHLTLQTRGTEFRLYDIDLEAAEKFYKYVIDKKTPPPKTTITARDVEVAPPPKK